MLREHVIVNVSFINRSTFCQNIQNFNCGLSDVHNIISVQIKGTIPRINKKFIEYRSFKNFDQEIFLNDLEQKNLNSIVDKCDNVNSAYENFDKIKNITYIFQWCSFMLREHVIVNVSQNQNIVI
jgi:hypothetical protein